MEFSSFSYALSSPGASRFGHAGSLIFAHDSAWSTEMAIVWGGVKKRDTGDVDELQPGGDEIYTATNSLSVLDIDGQRWFTPKTNDGPSPRAFSSSSTTGKTMWLFGGHVLHSDSVAGVKKRTRVFFSELWSLDTDTWTFTLEWNQESEVKGPSKRDMATLSSVGGGKLILFGGRGENGRALSDLWSFDIHSKMWTLMKPPLPHPSPRKLHAAVSIGGGRLLIYGGERDLGSPLDDLWTLRGLDMEESSPVRWTLIKLRPSPGPRFGHSLSFLSSSAKTRDMTLEGGVPASLSRPEEDQLQGQAYVFLFGGSLSHSEAWCINLSSFKWSKIQGKIDLGSRSIQPRLCHTIVPLSPTPTSDDKVNVSDNSSVSFRLLLIGGRGNQGVVGGEDAAWIMTACPTPHQREILEESNAIEAISSVFGSAVAPVNLFRSLIGFTPLSVSPSKPSSAPAQKVEPQDPIPGLNPRSTDEILTPLEFESEDKVDDALASKGDSNHIWEQLRCRIGLIGETLSESSHQPSSFSSFDPSEFKLGSVSSLLERVHLTREASRKEMANRVLSGSLSLSSFVGEIDLLSHDLLPDSSNLKIGQIKILMKELETGAPAPQASDFRLL